MDRYCRNIARQVAQGVLHAAEPKNYCILFQKFQVGWSCNDFYRCMACYTSCKLHEKLHRVTGPSREGPLQTVLQRVKCPLHNNKEFSKENVTLKLNFALSWVSCDYSMLITLYKIGGVHFRLLGTDGFHLKAKNERFNHASSRWRQNIKFENFTSSFGRLRQKIAPKSVPHVQHENFFSFNQSNHWFVALSLTLPSSNLKGVLASTTGTAKKTP